MQCVFIGIPRSGKSSLMKRIVGESLPDISPSTGIADKAVQVIVRPSAAAVRESDSTWTKLKDNEEAAIIVTDTSRSLLGPVGGNPTSIMNASQHPVSDVPTPAAGLPSPELSTKGPMDICRHALQNAEKILREPGWLVYLTDTGGQIEFQELLPQLVSGPVVFFLVFPLNKKLNERFEVEYVYCNGKKSEPYISAFTMQDALIQSLASIASMGSN